MGGVLGLAIVTCVFNSFVESRLGTRLSGEQLNAILRSAQTIATLDPRIRDTVRHVFAEGYDLQMRVVVGFAAAQFGASGLMMDKVRGDGRM